MESPLLAFVFILFTVISSASAQVPPSPGYYPSSNVASQAFNQVFTSHWGQHHHLLEQGQLTVLLDRSSGSGFKSLRSYRSGYFGASIKVQSGYTAGVVTSFYLSNNEEFPGSHDEIDFEFLGTIPGRPYVLQTNVYTKGSGDGNTVGREMRTHLWFDPTENYHHYAILWNPREIIFLVDDVPIRRYGKEIGASFPARPMRVYGSIWDASSWATENGKYKADYQHQPFIGRYADFKIEACASDAPATCLPPPASPSSLGGLSVSQIQAMQWVQRNLVVYDYCRDAKGDPSRVADC